MNLKRHCGHLSKKQRAVIEDMFKNGLSEHKVLEKYKIRPCRYRDWLENGLFTQEINNRIDAAIRQSKLVMARWLPLAAERLAQLTISEKDETARKACLDVISLHTPETEQKTAQTAQTVQAKEIKPLPPEIASKLLAALVEKDTELQASALDIETKKICPPCQRPTLAAMTTVASQRVAAGENPC